jgi:Holliday junction DNA helicase RuvA
MIERIRGRIEIKSSKYVVVFLHGFGFEIKMSEKSIESFSDDENEVSILTYLHVKEDALDLYGFFSEIERKTFLLLITINGIGPKLALTILSGMRPEKLNYYIAHNDLKSLTAIAGVGTKTAKRIILELKDKVDMNNLNLLTDNDNKINQQLFNDTVNALISLGYKNSVAKEACVKLQNSNELEGKIQDVLKKALAIIVS